MPKYTGPNPNSGPYNVPNGKTMQGGGKYNKIVTAAATFYATGSNGGVIAVSSTAGATVTLFDGGSLVIPASTTQPIEASVVAVTAGTAFLYYK